MLVINYWLINSTSLKNKTPPTAAGFLVLVADNESLQIIQKSVTGKSYNQPAKKRRDSITQVADLSMPARHLHGKFQSLRYRKGLLFWCQYLIGINPQRC